MVGVMSASQHPLIAINGLYQADDPMLTLRQRYVDFVRGGGGIPVVLAPGLLPDDATPEQQRELDEELDQLLERVDGLVLTGGDDFHAGPLGLGATHPSAEATHLGKQRYDLALTRAALRRDLPTLGICFGMQCLGLSGGATLHQDLPKTLPDGAQRGISHADSAIHTVTAQEGTKLANSSGLAPFPVVSRHHQALRTVPPPWIVSAMDEENLIEAIEHPSLKFAVGVQWHPELGPSLLPKDPAAQALMHAFLHAARSAR